MPALPNFLATGKPMLHLALVLDRSGSMEDCRDATINGFNEYVDSIRSQVAPGGLQIKVTLVTFNQSVVFEAFKAPLANLQHISRASYVPDGMTAMLDAVGETIDRLEKDVKNANQKSFLVCVVSDGYENSSHRYTYPEIAGQIKRLTAAGNWTFTYLGSNQDLSKVADQLHIPAGNIAAYSPTPTGTERAWTDHSQATLRRMAGAAAEVPAPGGFYSDAGIADLTEEESN